MELQKRREGLKILCPLLTDVYTYFAGFETRSLSENGLSLVKCIQSFNELYTSNCIFLQFCAKNFFFRKSLLCMLVCQRAGDMEILTLEIIFQPIWHSLTVGIAELCDDWLKY